MEKRHGKISGGTRAILGVTLVCVFLIMTLISEECYAAPPNDLFADAVTISGASGQATGTTVDATNELATGEPHHAGAGPWHSVWWRWTAPSSGPFAFDTHGSSFNTVLAVYTGTSLSGLTEVASNNNDGSADLTSVVFFDGQAGVQYIIAVDTVLSDLVGDVVLNWREATPPPNDDFDSAKLITESTGPIRTTNIDASSEPEEPTHAVSDGIPGLHGGSSVWWKWTAPRGGTVIFDTHGSTFDTVLAVYTGNAVNGLNEVAANNEDRSDQTSKVSFDANTGVEYHIAVAGRYLADVGEIALKHYYQNPEETYAFEHMWPPIQHPWYFSQPVGIDLDAEGNVYVTDTFLHRVRKFNAEGQFITAWGTWGTGDGQFQYPHGILVGPNGSIYVVDNGNDRVQVFNLDGDFIRTWGSEGSGPGQFNEPSGIAMDAAGNLYVADLGNFRVQKVDSQGTPLNEWGRQGTGPGQLNFDLDTLDELGSGIAVDANGRVYVADSENHRIQIFTSDGAVIGQWGGQGSDLDQLNSPRGITVDGEGNIYITDSFNHRVQKRDPQGNVIDYWGQRGSGNGDFDYPTGIAVAEDGTIYVNGFGNDRVQKFDSNGDFLIWWGAYGHGKGEFFYADGIVENESGDLLVVDRNNHRVQTFRPDGTWIGSWTTPPGYVYIPMARSDDGSLYLGDCFNQAIVKYDANGTYQLKWGASGTGVGQFNEPRAIALDGQGNVLVADTNNHRIQIFDSNGTPIRQWGEAGSDDGFLLHPRGIAIDSEGNVYVADSGNHRIQKFTTHGEPLSQWGCQGIDFGEFIFPAGIDIDDQGNVYVVDQYNNRVQKFNASGQFITSFGGLGSEAGLFNYPSYVYVGSDGRVYVSGDKNHRVQVFSPAVSIIRSPKAIIVAGSGPFAGNNIWDATQLCANYAYRALTYQGYSRETIQYLSADTDLDLDGNGVLDDVDGDATNLELQTAISTWANDAEDLLIYMIGHGGDGVFRMGESENLTAEQLDGWLDAVQSSIPGSVVVIIDACQSGSFIAPLTPASGQNRIVITSTSVDREAMFVADGTISFSYLFWAHIFNGDAFSDAYDHARLAMEETVGQVAHLEADGDGTANEGADLTEAAMVHIGEEHRSASDIPSIVGVNATVTLDGGDVSADLYAESVTDADGINRAWAVITPPDFASPSPNQPVTALPHVNLGRASGDRYESTYDGFTRGGTYRVTVYAKDKRGYYSLPARTSVIQTVHKGDLDQDEDVDLVDALIVLKVLSGIDVTGLLQPGFVGSMVDVNGDEQVGLEDLSYILKTVARTAP